ncbi:MAG: AAA family ATPase, partial [Clostridia bacterium]|nr:AAA family ATPase [Clostridia bacterium]
DGAVVVRYNANDDDEDDDRVSADIETVGVICDTMMKYRNQVLTVFCLPREGERTKKIFYENLGSVGLIEIREDLADFEKSCDYLKFLCKKQHIRPDKKLFGKLEDDKMYLPDDLRTTFDEWYNVKMKTTVFPQYKEVSACRKEAAKEAPKGTAYDELNEMIGLTEAKSVIEKALAYYKIQRIYKDKGIKQDRAAMHMVFTGNPGTAKTTVARLFARIMKENGLLSRGHLVEVGRSDLVGKYVGWTAPTVKEKFKAAAGGVLFIDEAYSLVDDRGGLYGDEAINTIVQEMENRREDLVVIFAGYPDKMEEFLCKNPGLRSRIAFYVPFADYNTEELCDIARMIGKAKGVSFSGKAMDKLSVLFDCVRMQDDFGNGRYVRNLIELSKMNQACRILGKDPETVTEKALTLIEEEDIELLTPGPKNTARQIGFAV